MVAHNSLPLVLTDQQPLPISQCDCACDCACPNVLTKTGQRHLPVAGGEYVAAPRVFTMPIRGEYSLLVNPEKGQPAVVNDNAFQLWKESLQPQRFPDMGVGSLQTTLAIQQMLDLTLIQSHSFQLTASNPQISHSLVAWLHLTNSCNLRCSYCYVKKDERAMSFEIGLRAVEAVFRSACQHDFLSVKLKYAGGEPVLNFPLVLRLHRYTRQLAAEKKLELDGVILTNGIGWTNAMIKAVLSNAIHVMVSIDGRQVGHDQQRFFSNGKGSAAYVLETIERMLTYELIPYLSITVTQRNLAELPELVAWALERGLPFSFNFYRENQSATRETGLQSTQADLISGMKSVYRVIEANLPVWSLTNGLLDRVNMSGPHHYTCPAGQSYMVIDTVGNIACCQMEIDQPVTNILAEDPLLNIRSAASRTLYGDVDNKEDCHECLWRYWCAGGCPIVTSRVEGRFGARSPHCEVYKHLIPEVLRLESLRILKYSPQAF